MPIFLVCASRFSPPPPLVSSVCALFLPTMHSLWAFSRPLLTPVLTAPFFVGLSAPRFALHNLRAFEFQICFYCRKDGVVGLGVLNTRTVYFPEGNGRLHEAKERKLGPNNNTAAMSLSLYIYISSFLSPSHVSVLSTAIQLPLA